MPANAYWESLKVCYVAVALCVGVQHPKAMPKVVIRPGAQFACGRLCYDPPASKALPTLCDDLECASCQDVHTMLCAGDYSHHTVTVAAGALNAIPHEFIHAIVQSSGLDKEGDSGHMGPWWDCQKGVGGCEDFKGWKEK
jgi:hypothetical protein